MCYAKPGPRCSRHAREALDSAISVGNVGDILIARDNFDETKAGQDALSEAIDRASGQKKRTNELRARKEAAATRRLDKIARYKALEEMRASDTGSSAVLSMPRTESDTPRRRVSPETARVDAEKATKRYVGYIASLRDADPHEVERTLLELKMQYRREFASLPEDERPDPPQEWVDSISNSRGEGVARLPVDAASRYAFYRAQFDPSVFAEDKNRRYAVVDVETAEEDFVGRPRPENGSIIEVGIVEYDADGNELSSWGQLIHPGEERAARIGTGAVEVHNITMDDVKDSPQWVDISDEVRTRLEGRTVVAHNAKFDSAYLGHHLYGTRYLPQTVIDTLSVSRLNNPELENHKLSTVAASYGVIYDNGHRAEHDALVCGKALFAMRRKMREDWEKSQCARILRERELVGV